MEVNLMRNCWPAGLKVRRFTLQVGPLQLVKGPRERTTASSHRSMSSSPSQRRFNSLSPHVPLCPRRSISSLEKARTSLIRAIADTLIVQNTGDETGKQAIRSDIERAFTGDRSHGLGRLLLDETQPSTEGVVFCTWCDSSREPRGISILTRSNPTRQSTRACEQETRPTLMRTRNDSHHMVYVLWTAPNFWKPLRPLNDLVTGRDGQQE